MQYMIESTAPSKQIVEIQLWGLYLLNNRTDLYSEMIASSLDHGPVEKNPHAPGRVTFRFDVGSWNSKIKKLLYSHRIPVIMKGEAQVSIRHQSALGVFA
jgi:hypothetical protein